jgi:hypothetical protein
VLLRRGRPEDADGLFQIRNEPEVARWWGADDIEGEISEQFIEANKGFVIECLGKSSAPDRMRHHSLSHLHIPTAAALCVIGHREAV